MGQPTATKLRQQRAAVALGARGGEYEVSDADIAAFYAETISGSGGDPPKGTIVAELIVKFFYGDFTPQGFKRYSGLWKGPPPGTIGKKDIKMGMEGLKAQMKNPMFVTKGGVGYGVDETQKVVDDGKGALLVAKSSNVDEMFDKVNWDLMDKRIDTTL